jgi:hypothetical protein
MEIIKRLSSVMEAVGGVSKSERNAQQGFSFRGIDAVVNAVSPALRKEGVVVVPRVIDSTYETVVVGKNQTSMGHARVTVEYAFYAGDGSQISCIVAAESMDSGDKATAKAMSVAFRTALLQALCLPTDEMDPDHQVYERSSAPSRPAVKPAARPVGKKPALSKAHQKWIAETVQKGYPGEDLLVFVGDILGREIGSLDDVAGDEAPVVINALAGVK